MTLLGLEEREANVRPLSDAGHGLPRTRPRRFLPVAGKTLITIAACWAVVWLALYPVARQALVRQKQHDLDLAVADRGLLVHHLLEDANEKALAEGAPEDIATLLRTFHDNPGDGRVTAALFNATRGFADHGFTAVAFEAPAGDVLAVGNFISRPAFQIALHTAPPSTLLWSNGFLVNTGIPARDADGVAGLTILQQRLPALDVLASPQNALRWGSSAHTEFCSTASGKGCLSLLNGGITADSGTPAAHRPRRIVARGAVGDTGLEIQLSVEISEVTAPLRERLLLATSILSVLLMVFFPAAYVLRRQAPREALQETAPLQAELSLAPSAPHEDEISPAIEEASGEFADNTAQEAMSEPIHELPHEPTSEAQDTTMNESIQESVIAEFSANGHHDWTAAEESVNIESSTMPAAGAPETGFHKADAALNQEEESKMDLIVATSSRRPQAQPELQSASSLTPVPEERRDESFVRLSESLKELRVGPERILASLDRIQRIQMEFELWMDRQQQSMLSRLSPHGGRTQTGPPEEFSAAKLEQVDEAWKVIHDTMQDMCQQLRQQR